MESVPDGLRWLAASEEGRAWLSALPGLYDRAVERWRLRVGDPFPYAFASLAAPALLPDGTEAVLKLAFPHRESAQEADALRLWDGEGAVQLLGDDSDSGALLLERCRPGQSLSMLDPGSALDVIVDLLPRLWVVAGVPFRPLADEAAWWASYLERRWDETGRILPRAIVDAALGNMEQLAPTQGEAVLVNQDLHAGNVLSATRQPWLLIDPKPLVGEREFGVASIVRDPEIGGHSRSQVFARLERLCGGLGLDRQRAWGWALVQTVAWSFEGDRVLAGHVDVARWLYEAR